MAPAGEPRWRGAILAITSGPEAHKLHGVTKTSTVAGIKCQGIWICKLIRTFRLRLELKIWALVADFSHSLVLDHPMMATRRRSEVQLVLVVGCGEGLSGRMMAAIVLEVVVSDQKACFWRMRIGRAGHFIMRTLWNLLLANGSFDLVIICLNWIDIANSHATIAEMARDFEPWGDMLIVNEELYHLRSD